MDVEARGDELARFFALLGLARGDGDARAVASQEAGRALASGPVPARMTTFLPVRSPSASSIFTTAATAVVFDPFESSMIETRSGSNMASCAMASSCSPADMLLPPIQTAVLCRSLAPRVKMQP